jgi:hypothetical protein
VHLYRDVVLRTAQGYRVLLNIHHLSATGSTGPPPPTSGTDSTATAFTTHIGYASVEHRAVQDQRVEIVGEAEGFELQERAVGAWARRREV